MKTIVLGVVVQLLLFLPAPGSTAGAQAISNDSPRIDSVIIARETLEARDFRRQQTFLPQRIGLALSGGGARGLAHIGILKAFDEAGIAVSSVAGTSMGGVVGGLYASGYSAEEIERIVKRIDFPGLFLDSPRRQSLFMTQRAERERYLLSIRFDGVKPYVPRALTAGQRLTSLLADLTIRADYTCEGDFDRLPIPFRATATDIGNGSEVVISGGSLADAMRATMAIPLAFTPAEIDGRHLLDGGIVDPVPVGVCRDLGADYVVAVNTTSTLLKADKVDNPVDVANQVTTIMSQDALANQLRLADYIITPSLQDFESFDFNRCDSLVALGYKAGVRAISDIRQAMATNFEQHGVRLRGVEIARDDSLLKGLRTRFPLKPGMYCTENRIREALAFADAGMRFHRLVAVIERDDSGVVVRLDGEPTRACNRIRYTIVGSTVIPDSEFVRFLPMPTDSALSLISVKEAADSVIALLHRDGHDLAYVRSIGYNHGESLISIVIDEGLLDYVDIRGNQRTRSWIIKANYPLRPGQPFDIHESDKGVSNIYGTGFFERVSLDIRPTGKGVHLTINVKEKKFTQMRMGAHWDDEYQAEALTELLDDNVFGAGIQAQGHVRIGSRRNHYSLSLKAARLSRTLITAQTRVYFSRLQRRLFLDDGAPSGFRIEDRLGWSILIGQQIARLGTINFEYRLEDIYTRLSLTGQTDNNILSTFAVKSTVETFNKYPYPDYGHLQDVSIEFTGPWLGGTFEEYTRLSGSVEAYAPVGNYLNFHPRIAAGTSTSSLPDVEKFYLGGMYDFSGYRTHQLAGHKFFVTNFQLRLRLPYRLYLLGNFDYGNVFSEYQKIRIKDFRKGWGAALSLDTPVGPIDVGYGNAEDMPWRLYLNAGLRF